MKTVLITGVTSGLGLGLANKFLEIGCRVIGSVRSEEQALQLQNNLGDDFVPLVFDLSRSSEIEAAAKKLKGILGDQHLDALINNAGSAEIGPLLHVSMEEFRKQLEVLVVGQLFVIQQFYSFLIPNDTSLEAGRILNISSISGSGSNYLFGAYAAGKHALEGMSKTLRLEMRLHGIKVVVVAPGNIATSIWKKQTNAVIEKYKDTIYFQSLRKSVENMNTKTIQNAIPVQEFSDLFITIFNEKDPAKRYTVIKSKGRLPFGKEKLRVYRK